MVCCGLTPMFVGKAELSATQSPGSSWLSPVGLPHVLVLGLGTFAVTYWYERRSAS